MSAVQRLVADVQVRMTELMRLIRGKQQDANVRQLQAKPRDREQLQRDYNMTVAAIGHATVQRESATREVERLVNHAFELTAENVKLSKIEDKREEKAKQETDQKAS